MTAALFTGFDLGGAHLKVAQLDPDGRVRQAFQLPCPLWQGLVHFEQALKEARDRTGPVDLAAVTMSGELVDLFLDRREGVRRLIELFQSCQPEATVLVYGGQAGFLSASAAMEQPLAVASANWHGSAALVARHVGEALFVDIGSTTTDIIPLAHGQVAARGACDRERLALEELVYTGVTRTPVIALAECAPLKGEWIPLTAEQFATSADVHRLLGLLPEAADQLPAADGGDKTVAGSARRLARMLGMDADQAPFRTWEQVAGYLAERQLRRISDACARVLSRGDVGDGAPVVGAGSGCFLVERLASRLECPYVDALGLIPAEPDAAEWAGRCLPAVAVALLARETA